MSETEVTEGQLLSQDFGVGGTPAAPAVPKARRNYLCSLCPKSTCYFFRTE